MNVCVCVCVCKAVIRKRREILIPNGYHISI